MKIGRGIWGGIAPVSPGRSDLPELNRQATREARQIS